jgi:hypothetical protein
MNDGRSSAQPIRAMAHGAVGSINTLPAVFPSFARPRSPRRRSRASSSAAQPSASRASADETPRRDGGDSRAGVRPVPVLTAEARSIQRSNLARARRLPSHSSGGWRARRIGGPVRARQSCHGRKRPDRRSAKAAASAGWLPITNGPRLPNAQILGSSACASVTTAVFSVWRLGGIPAPGLNWPLRHWRLPSARRGTVRGDAASAGMWRYVGRNRWDYLQ